MARFKKYEGPPGEWTEWVAPTMKKYRMGCCDCGLVHDMEFSIVRVTRRKGQDFDGKQVSGHRVLFRVKRNNRSTARMRHAHSVEEKSA